MPDSSLEEADVDSIDISSRVLRAELDSLLERFRDDTVIDGISHELVGFLFCVHQLALIR